MAPIHIYVDADACPVQDEIYRVAARHRLPVSVVANGFIRVPQDPLIERVAAGAAPDAADDWIAARAGAGTVACSSRPPPTRELALRKARRDVTPSNTSGGVETWARLANIVTALPP